jgi:hypothetical protein
MVFQPEYLGYLHLKGHLSTDVAQNFMTSGIDGIRLLRCAVVQPENDIAFSVEVGCSDRDGVFGFG